jgi:protein-glutamine gamma-glutamyltransferase
VSPMLGPTRRAAGGPSASAFAGLALFGVVAWVPVAGLGVALRLAVLAALAFVVATSKSRRVATFALVACAPVAWLLTGLSPTLVAPWHWAALGAGLAAGTRDLFPAASDAEGLTVWSRAAALGILVMFWIVAAVVARRHQETGARTLGFLCLAAPVALSILARGSNDQAWLGAAVVPLALAWYRPRRVGRGLGATTAAAAAVVAVTVAGIAGPRDGWLTAAAAGPTTTDFRGFDPSHSYGPLVGRRDGTTVLRVDSHEPSYWRVRVLSQVDRRGWHAQREEPDLPEPAAHRETIEVEVRALRSRSIVTPGDVVDVAGVGTTTGPGGEVSVDRSPLGLGESYRVEADVTRASPAELSAAPAPTSDALRAYTAVELMGRSVEIPLFGSPIPPATAVTLERSPYRRTLDLARRLARGADTPLDVVNRVQGYLEGGFRYDTDVEDGDRPLEEFLFSRHTGYCQHFSGAAALLLRLAGVPARVVTGFAPGRYDSGRGVWQVRDLDAHSWVEVYFEGLGWITVDPTPSAGPASVPPAAQPLLGDTGVPANLPVPAPAGAVALVVPVTWGVIQVRRHRRRDPDAEAIMLLRTLAGRTSPLPPGATYSELGRSLERLCGPETALLAHDLEVRSFRSSAPARPPVRLRGVWQALRRDRGLVRGSCLAAHAVWLVRDQTVLVADHEAHRSTGSTRARGSGPANGRPAPTGRPGSRPPGRPATGAPPPRP